MPKSAAADEIWRVDLGLTAKVRPCLLMSDYPAEKELALVLVIPHTTQFVEIDGSFPQEIPSKTWCLSPSANLAYLAEPAGDQARRPDER